MLGAFLELEAKHAGWRFWILWVLATNVGFFPGQALGERLSASMADPAASAVQAGCLALGVGVTQWVVLRRHVTGVHHWITATVVGWAIGAGLGAWLLLRFAPGVEPRGLPWILAIGVFAGALVGLPQQYVLARFDARLARGWVAISALAWGVFFPGAVSGLFLAYRLARRSG